LNDFDNQLKNFVKVFPIDYKNALRLRTTIPAAKEYRQGGGR
jgi:hypothetical protein